MNPIFLIGYMGAGKSTIGRKLADELGWSFIDTDIFIEARFRERICDMFTSVGEEVFRRRERVVIEELSGMENCIIATGGGLPCFHGNMDLMNTCGTTLYLSATNEVLAERLELCKRTRPSVRNKTGEELLLHVQEAMSVRDAIYRQAQLEESVNELRNEEDEVALAIRLAQRLRQLRLV
ncbi:MAG: shikimate kinase [Porphyromonadaceae bacterium]|nr:shikimate kinase [Porphyromonadaceae bacterium]